MQVDAKLSFQQGEEKRVESIELLPRQKKMCMSTDNNYFASPD